ncbi:uncharacterized protein LOC117586589 isoform X3 [Drosophila guanche]|uniref:uncharacterized protein LOC117586589 isoform X2 n=1 Tax=Drosophila guanche TaxID=7266 RepID=UPI001471D2F1|nr:uncharacterized protein LOC117586589 isoform X2 [Drosophila guanche]XP_034132650.1 uncharacterized protein LOC117586589 isoform X3 [Drosophila guanche]
MDEDQLERIVARARLGVGPIRQMFMRHFVSGGTEQDAFFDCQGFSEDCESRRERDRDRERDVGHDSDAMRCALERTATNIQMMLNSLDEMSPPNRPIDFTLEITTALAVNDDKRPGPSGRITGQPVTVHMPLQFDPRTRQLTSSCQGQQQHQMQASICGSRPPSPTRHGTDYPALTYLQDECRRRNNTCNNKRSRPQDIQTDQSYLQKHRQQSPVSLCCPAGGSGAGTGYHRPSQTETSYLRDHKKPQFNDAQDSQSEGNHSSQDSQTASSYVNDQYKQQRDKLTQERTSQTQMLHSVDKLTHPTQLMPCDNPQDGNETIYTTASNPNSNRGPCPYNSSATTSEFYHTPCQSSVQSTRHAACGCSLHNYLPRSEMDNRPPFACDPRPMTCHECLCGGQHQSDLPPWTPNPKAQHIAVSSAETNCGLQWAAKNEEDTSYQSAATTCFTQNSESMATTLAPHGYPCSTATSACPITSTIDLCLSKGSSKGCKSFTTWNDRPDTCANSACPVTSTIGMCSSTALTESAKTKEVTDTIICGTKTDSSNDAICTSNTFAGACSSKAIAEPCPSKTIVDPCSLKSLPDACASKAIADPCSLKAIADPCSLKSLPDPCSLKSLPDPCSLKSLPDPCASKSIADPCSLKSLPDPCSLKSLPDPCASKSIADPCSLKSLPDPCASKSIADPCSLKSLPAPCASKAFADTYTSKVDLNPCSSRGFADPTSSKVLFNSCISKAVSNSCHADTSSTNALAFHMDTTVIEATCGTQTSVLPMVGTSGNLEAEGSDHEYSYTTSGTQGLPPPFGCDDQTSGTSRSRSVVNKITCFCSSDQKSIYNNHFEKGPREEGHVQYGDELMGDNSDHCNTCEVCPPPQDPMQSIGSSVRGVAPKPLSIKCDKSTCTCTSRCRSMAKMKSQSKEQSRSKQVFLEEQDVFRDCDSFNSNVKSVKSKSSRRLSYADASSSLPIITSCYSKDQGAPNNTSVCPCGCGLSQIDCKHSRIDTSGTYISVCGQDNEEAPLRSCYEPSIQMKSCNDAQSMEMKSCYDPSLDKQSESGYFRSPDTSAYTEYTDASCKEVVGDSRKERIMDMVQQLSDAADCDCNEDRPAMIQNLFRELALMLRMEEERAVAPQDEIKTPKPTFEECCAIQQQYDPQPVDENVKGSKERRRIECFETLDDAVRKCFMKQETKQLPEVEIYALEEDSDSDREDACARWLPSADSTIFKDVEGQGCGNDDEFLDPNSQRHLLEQMTKLIREPSPKECDMSVVVEPCRSYDRNKFEGDSCAKMAEPQPPSNTKVEPEKVTPKVPSNVKVEPDKVAPTVDPCASQNKSLAKLDKGNSDEYCPSQCQSSKIEPCPTITPAPSQVPSAMKTEICVTVENYKQTESCTSVDKGKKIDSKQVSCTSVDKGKKIDSKQVSCTSVDKGKKIDSKQELCASDLGNLLPDGPLSPEARQLCEKLLRQALVDCGACDKLAPSQSCQSSEVATRPYGDPKGAGHCQCCHCRALKSESECKTVSKTLRSALCDPACEMKYFIDSMIVDLEVMDHVLDNKKAKAKDVSANCLGNEQGTGFPVTISAVSSLGCTALYIKWDVQDCAGIAGYEIYVDGNLRSRLYSYRHEAAVVGCVDVTKGHQIVLRAQAIGQDFPGDDLPVGNCKTVAHTSHPEMLVGAKRPWSPSIYFYDPSMGIRQAPGARRASQT